MARAHITVFKCLVNISVQDFGVYFRRRAKFGPDHIAEQHGGLEDPAEGKLASLEDVQEVVGVFNGWPGAVMALKGTWKWMGGALTLVGWLWWLWAVWLGELGRNHDPGLMDGENSVGNVARRALRSRISHDSHNTITLHGGG